MTPRRVLILWGGQGVVLAASAFALGGQATVAALLIGSFASVFAVGPAMSWRALATEPRPAQPYSLAGIGIIMGLAGLAILVALGISHGLGVAVAAAAIAALDGWFVARAAHQLGNRPSQAASL